jgi:hypothetical protein
MVRECKNSCLLVHCIATDAHFLPNPVTWIHVTSFSRIHCAARRENLKPHRLRRSMRNSKAALLAPLNAKLFSKHNENKIC